MTKENKMKNESEFVFDGVLNTGFTIIPNEIFDDERLSNNAIAVYCKIIRRRNIEDWKIYQSALVNKKNGIDKIASAIKELVNTGWLTKERLRNKKGQVQGMKYTVYSTPQIKEENHVEPKQENPKQDNPKVDFPKQENPRLKRKNTTNKENTKKYNTNKDTTQSQVPCSKSDEDLKVSSSQVEAIEDNTHLILTNNQFKKVSSWNILRLYKAIDIFKSRSGEYFALLEKIYKDNGNFVDKGDKTVSNASNKCSSANFTERQYDYDKLEKQLLGWDTEEDED